MTDEAKQRFYNDMLDEFEEVCKRAEKGMIIQYKDKMRSILKANSPKAKSFEFLEERCAAAYYRGKLEMLDTLYDEISKLKVNINQNDLELGNNRCVHKVIKLINEHRKEVQHLKGEL